MTDDRPLTMSQFLRYLRKKLIEARNAKDTKLLTELGNAFDLIEAAAFEADDRTHAAIAEEMRSAVRDAFMGSEWKSNIPSESEIDEVSR